MAWRFRKSKSFGLFRVTATKRGLSLSTGVRGARIGVNTHGQVRRTVGVPGTGLYATKVSGGGGWSRRRQSSGGPRAAQDHQMVSSVTDATGGERLRQRDGVQALKVVGVKGYEDLAATAGFSPRSDGWVGGLRGALLLDQGGEYAVIMLVGFDDNPRVFARRDDRAQPRGFAIGRLGKRDFDKWAAVFEGRTIGTTLYLAATPGLEGEAWVRFIPDLVQGQDDERPAKAAETAAEHAPPLLPPAGWYADPEAQAVYRYWDGSSWTEQVSNGS